ncbi:hypothetical protein [Actinoplanes subtropicus]|uniref:hypothetical protein n=1 Tax=Actinoplanes subtropicus TaxID=543632 RepID=UPI0004C3D540|nr:hypothetical protein [Actinoplanes subtropicus]
MDQPLRSWVEEHALPGRRVAAERDLTGGYSNQNTLITMADGEQFVLRRYRGANACAVEAALAVRLTGVVPIPEVLPPTTPGRRPASRSCSRPSCPAGRSARCSPARPPPSWAARSAPRWPRSVR